MKKLDYFLQEQRIKKAAKFIHQGSYVLDIGCADGALFRLLKNRLLGGVGIDPGIAEIKKMEGATFYPGRFPDDLPPQEGKFDVITMLAMLEHIPMSQQHLVAMSAKNLLKKGGIIIITIPSPIVDNILNILHRLGQIDGMSLEDHYGLKPDSILDIYERSDLHLVIKEKFQLGLNNLFVFRKEK